MNPVFAHPTEKTLALVQSTSLTRLVAESIEEMILADATGG